MLMRNSTLIRLICLILSLFVVVSLLGACSKTDTADTSSEPSNDSQTDDDSYDDEDDEFEDDDSGDDWDDMEDDDWDDEEDEDDDDDDGTYSEELFVYNSEEPITKNYRGISASVYRHDNYIMDDKYGRGYTDEQKEIELTRLQETNTRFVRQYYQPAHAWNNSADGGRGGWDLGGNGRIKYFWDYCRGLQSKGINVLLGVGWHLEVYAKDSTSMAYAPYINNLEAYPEEFYGESAGFDYSTCKNAEFLRMARESLRMGHFIVETYKYAKAHGINNITHFLYFVETSYMNTKYPEEDDYLAPEGDSAPEYVHVVKTIQWKLKREGVYDLVSHIGPNQSREHGDGLVRYMLERGCEDMFDVWTMHFYPCAPDLTSDVYFDICDPIFQSYVQPLKDYGIFGKDEFWYDEGYAQADNSKNGIENGWAGLQNAVVGIVAQQRGIDNWSTWQIFDQLWVDQITTSVENINGIAICGSSPSLLISSIPKAQYYGTGLYSRYNGWRGGWAYRTNEADLAYNAARIHVGAVKLEDGSWTITVVNTSIDEFDITIKFDKAIYQTLYRHYVNVSTLVPTTAARIPDADKTFANVKDILTDTIEGSSIVVYTGVKG